MLTEKYCTKHPRGAETKAICLYDLRLVYVESGKFEDAELEYLADKLSGEVVTVCSNCLHFDVFG